MKRKRFAILWVGALMGAMCWTSVPAAVAGDADVLGAVPSNAWATLTVRNLAEFDKKIIGFSQQLNTPPMSLLAMAKGMLGLVSGVDDAGTVAVVIMPVQNIMAPQEGLAIFVPVSDFSEMTSMLQPADAGDGVTKIMLAGQEGYCGQRGDFAVLAEKPELVKTVLAADSSTGIRSAWSQHQIERFAVDDITLWINAKEVFANPMVAGMMQMMSQGQTNMDDLKAMESLCVSTRLEKTGVRLGFYYGADENSRQGKAISSVKPTKDSLLTGLPEDDYVLAMGMNSSQEHAALVSEEFAKMANNPALAMMGADPEAVKKMSDLLSTIVGDLRGVSFSVSGMPDGADGLLGLTKIVTVQGNASGMAKQISELIGAISTVMPMPEVQAAMKAIKYSAGAESVGGVSVDHLTVALDQMEGMNPEDFAKVKQLVGSEGLTFRIAAVDDKHIAMTMGGGKARLASVIGSVKGGDAPLADDEGIQRVAKTLRSERTMEGYLAADNLMHLVGRIAKAMNEDGPPNMPEVNVPAAMVGGPVAAGEFQIDFAVPMEVIVAIKDMAMSPPSGNTTH